MSDIYISYCGAAGDSVGVDGDDGTLDRPVAVLLRFILRGVLK